MQSLHHGPYSSFNNYEKYLYFKLNSNNNNEIFHILYGSFYIARIEEQMLLCMFFLQNLEFDFASMFLFNYIWSPTFISLNSMNMDIVIKEF